MANETTETKTVETETKPVETPPADTKPTEAPAPAEAPKADNAELNKLKAALDKATKEAADYKKALRAKQSAEEAAAEEAKEQQEVMMRELEALRKEREISNTTAKVMPIVNNDNAIAAQLAEYLHGADDVDSAIALITKAQTLKEKALRLEFGKIQAPGVGGSEGPALTKNDILKIKDPVARQKAIAENIQLFTQKG